MTAEQFNEFLYELNFSDISVGWFPVSLTNEQALSEILTEFQYTPIGYHETKRRKGFKFKADGDIYIIQEVPESDLLTIVEFIDESH